MAVGTKEASYILYLNLIIVMSSSDYTDQLSLAKWSWPKSTFIKLYPRPTLFSFINIFMIAISVITETAHKSNPHKI